MLIKCFQVIHFNSFLLLKLPLPVFFQMILHKIGEDFVWKSLCIVHEIIDLWVFLFPLAYFIANLGFSLLPCLLQILFARLLISAF